MTRFYNWLIPHDANLFSRLFLHLELHTATLFAVALGAAEGGVLGVIVSTIWSDTVSSYLLDQAIAIVVGAPAFANSLSLLWAGVSHGRDKIRWIISLQSVTALAILMLALTPHTPGGLLLFVIAGVSARVLWVGVVTVRSSVWRANFPRRIRATMASRVAGLSAVIMALSGALAGWVLQNHGWAFRLLFPAAAAAGLGGAYLYRRMGVRGHRTLRNQELARQGEAAVGLAAMWQILKQDRKYRHYMAVMFLFGSGNLMALAPLILVLGDMQSGAVEKVLISSSIPLLFIPLTIAWWARRLDRMHVIQYRATHSWSFVAALSLFAVGSALHNSLLLMSGAALLGVAYAGGLLGWNLGHNDFSSADRAAQYLGVHVTLTGVRGLIMPLVGVNLHRWFSLNTPWGGEAAMLVPLALCTSGAVAFLWLQRRYGGDTPVEV